MQYLQLWRLRLLGCSIHSRGLRRFIRLVSALPCPSSFCSKIHSYLFSRPYGWLRQCRYTVSFSISSLSLISIRCIQFLYFFRNSILFHRVEILLLSFTCRIGQLFKYDVLDHCFKLFFLSHSDIKDQNS